MQTKKINYIPGWEYCSICGDDAPRTPLGYSVHMKTVHGKHVCRFCGMDLDLNPFKEHSCRGTEVK